MKNTLPYLVKTPTNPTLSARAIFLLHGYGSDENDLFSFASELPKHCYIFSIQAPHALPMSGYAWYAIHYGDNQAKWSDDQQALDSIELLKETVESICNKYEIDKNYNTFIGFSQGTIMSYAFMSQYPKLVKNVVGLSGYINEAIAPFSKGLEAYTHLNVFASHGSVDQIIPVDWAHKIPSQLKAVKLTPFYKEYPTGHGICPENFYDFRDWLADKI